jgi:riboflavin synthase alpha subunit
MSKPSRTEQMVINRVNTAVQSGKKVTVDGVCIKGARFNNDEVEVNWDAEIEDEGLAWSVVQPNFLHEYGNGELELKTH